MTDLEETIRAAYLSSERQEPEATLSAVKDTLESHGGRAVDIGAVVDVLLDALATDADRRVVEWTLEALVGATFHPNFGSLDLTRLVNFLEAAEPRWVATGLEILSGTLVESHREFISSLTHHSDPKIVANALDALQEIEDRLASFQKPVP